MSDNIPFEIQLEIIKRVSDVRSLLRFRSVSKPFKSFIDTHKFPHHIDPNRFILSYKEVEYPCNRKYICLVDDNHTLTRQQELDPTVPLLIKELNDSRVVGCCNGVFCVYGVNNGRHMVVLWNPSLKKCVGMAVPHVSYYQHFGFGVCPVTYDPVIVRMSLLDINSKKVEVFTLSLGVWNLIPSNNMCRGSIIISSATGVVIDRFIYWMACEKIVGDDGLFRLSPKILSFDMITKEFKVVDLPYSLEKQLCRCNITISKLRESLVLLGFDSVWMMEHGGVITSFRKLFTFDTTSIYMIHGYRKSGEPIIETRLSRNDASLQVYSPSSKHIHNLGIYGERGPFCLAPHMETLLLHDHADCFIYDYILRSDLLPLEGVPQLVIR